MRVCASRRVLVPAETCLRASTLLCSHPAMLAPLIPKAPRVAAMESICIFFKRQCISEQITYHHASLCVLMDNSD